jgi:hypothetical protein
MTDNLNETKHTTLKEELESGRNVTFFTVGCSMQPLLIERQTHVMLSPIKDGVKKYDIVLYIRPEGTHVLHRCVKVMDGYCLMRGDNTYFLERVENFRMIGVVTHIYRKGKMIDVKKSGSYRFYSVFWNATYHLRHFIIKAGRKIKRWITKTKK